MNNATTQPPPADHNPRGYRPGDTIPVTAIDPESFSTEARGIYQNDIMNRELAELEG